jgi:hypothetical protein
MQWHYTLTGPSNIFFLVSLLKFFGVVEVIVIDFTCRGLIIYRAEISLSTWSAKDPDYLKAWRIAVCMFLLLRSSLRVTLGHDTQIRILNNTRKRAFY